MKKSDLVCWVLGAGVFPKQHLTLQAKQIIERSDQVICVLCNQSVLQDIQDLTSNLIEIGNNESQELNRYSLHVTIMKQLESKLENNINTVFVYQGHPGICCRSGHEIMIVAQKLGYLVKMLPGISSLDCLYADLAVDPCTAGLHIYDAIQLILHKRTLDPFIPTIILQSHAVISVVGEESTFLGLTLLLKSIASTHGSEHKILIYSSSSESDKGYSVISRRICDLSYDEFSPNITIYVPPSKTYSLPDDNLKQFTSIVQDLSKVVASNLMEELRLKSKKFF